MADQVLLCMSKNGKRITYDPIDSHAATHLQDTPTLKELVIEVLENMDVTGAELGTHVAMGRPIGTCDVVAVDETDEIIYGYRLNRDDEGHAPFTKSRSGTPCSDVALHIVEQSDDSYVLSSAWIGTFGGDDEPFPNAFNATARSKDFWNRHAIVYGSQEIKPGTETSACPW